MIRYIIFLSMFGCGSQQELAQPNPPPNWYIEEPASPDEGVPKQDPKLQSEEKKADVPKSDGTESGEKTNPLDEATKPKENEGNTP